jgi:hypothetical protein
MRLRHDTVNIEDHGMEFCHERTRNFRSFSWLGKELHKYLVVQEAILKVYGTYRAIKQLSLHTPTMTKRLAGLVCAMEMLRKCPAHLLNTPDRASGNENNAQEKSYLLVQEALADRRTAEARNAISRADLALELVVIRKFIVYVKLSQQVSLQSRYGVS